MTARINVEVLVVGGGGSGLTASMLLSSYGVTSHLVSRYPSTSHLPKASGLSIKTMEIFRELGIEDAIRTRAMPPAAARQTALYAGFAGDDPDVGRAIARLGAWGRGGEDLDWLGASTVRPALLQQSLLEPIMKAKAEAWRPGGVHFNHTFLSFDETADGILARIEDRATGETYEVAAQYLLACDGGRIVGRQLGVEMEGHLAVATSVSVHFSANLSRWFRDPSTFHAIILNPEVGIPCALLPMGPETWGADSTEWVVHLMSFAGDHQSYPDEMAVSNTKAALGLPDLDMTVHVINRWPLDAVVASRFRVGRAFMVGDAAHRMPPTGGNGLNTAVQDSYNICWKLAEVLRGKATDRLLATYEGERRPVAQRVVATAFAGWHRNRDLAGAIGFGPKNTPAENWAGIRRVWREDAEGVAVRRRVAAALEGLVPNFDQLNVAFGYTYEGEAALVPDGSPSTASHDPLAVYRPSTRPGHSLPDVCVDTLTERVSLGDLVGRRFVLIAGEAGGAWVAAARAVGATLGVDIAAFTVGDSEADWLDMRFAWRRVREHGPEGAILVRPDRFIAWRASEMADDCMGTLSAVFAALMKD